MVSKIEVSGTKEAIAVFKKLNKQTQQKVNKAIHNAGFFIEGEAKESIAGRRAEHVSVDTGQFVQSVNTNNTRMFISQVTSTVKHAKFLEFGTSKLKARRHFANTAARNKKKVSDFVLKEL